MIEAFGGLDIFVVNAGHQQFREDVSEVSTDDFDATLKTNLYALHWLCRTAAPHMPPGVAIITTASIQAYEPSDLLYTERVGGPNPSPPTITSHEIQGVAGVLVMRQMFRTRINLGQGG